MIVIPLLGYRILSEHPTRRAFGNPDTDRPGAGEGHHDIYDGNFYRRLRGWIGWCIDHRRRVLIVTVAVFVLSLAGLGLVPKQFFPSSDRPELLVDLRLPEGASFAATLREAQRLEGDLKGPSANRSLHRLRGLGRTALLSAARSAARRARTLRSSW